MGTLELCIKCNIKNWYKASQSKFRIKFQNDEIAKALANNRMLYEQDWTAYSDSTGYKISNNEEFAMSFADTILGTLMGSEGDVVDVYEQMQLASVGFVKELGQAAA